MAGSRVGNSLRNIFAAWGGQAIYALANFVVRAVFVKTLAQEFVGLETLFSSLLTILALADLGVGTAIVFALYEPLAKQDKELVKSLMRLFQRAYIIIGVVIITIGAIMAPNVRLLLGANAPHIPLLEIYFFCFVLDSGISYFFSYKSSLIHADQKSYIVYLIQYAFHIAMCLFQIAVLLFTANYLLFLACMITSTLIQNIILAVTANRMYPYLKEKNIAPLPKDILTSIKKNVAGLMLHRIAGVASTPVNNLVITTFIGLSVTSIYGNYLLVVQALDRILQKVFDSIVASVGNLGAEESEARQYEVFETTLFVNALAYGVISGGMLCAFNPFITMWVGAEWQFPLYLVALIVVLFYVKGMRSAAISFTSAYGLYWVTKWKAVLEAISLPLLSVILVQPFGMVGVLVASMISSLGISTIYEGWGIYRHGFHQPLHLYAIAFTKYVIVSVAAMLGAFWLCSLIALPPIVAFFVYGLIGVVSVGGVLLLCFGRTREAREAYDIIRRVGSKVVGKLRRAS